MSDDPLFNFSQGERRVLQNAVKCGTDWTTLVSRLSNFTPNQIHRAYDLIKSQRSKPVQKSGTAATPPPAPVKKGPTPWTDADSAICRSCKTLEEAKQRLKPHHTNRIIKYFKELHPRKGALKAKTPAPSDGWTAAELRAISASLKYSCGWLRVKLEGRRNKEIMQQWQKMQDSWSQEELQLVRNATNWKTVVPQIPTKTQQSIKQKWEVLHQTKHKQYQRDPWTSDEVAFLLTVASAEDPVAEFRKKFATHTPTTIMRKVDQLPVAAKKAAAPVVQPMARPPPLSRPPPVPTYKPVQQDIQIRHIPFGPSLTHLDELASKILRKLQLIEQQEKELQESITHARRGGTKWSENELDDLKAMLDHTKKEMSARMPNRKWPDIMQQLTQLGSSMA